MCAGPDSDVSGGKGARAVDGTTQSAIPALAGNPPVSQNPSQRHRRPTADDDARVSRRPSPPGCERSVLVDTGSSIRANAAASPPGRARSSPISTLPRRQSQTDDGLERRASNEAAARCEGSDEDSLTCRCPLDTPHKRRRAPSSSDTDDDATDDDDDDVRSPLKRRAAAEALAACPPAPRSGTPRFVRECSMDFASLLSILGDDRDAGALSRQNSSSFADETTWIDGIDDPDVDHLMCDVVADCLATNSRRNRPSQIRLESAPTSSSSPEPAPPPSHALTSSRGSPRPRRRSRPPSAANDARRSRDPHRRWPSRVRRSGALGRRCGGTGGRFGRLPTGDCRARGRFCRCSRVGAWCSTRLGCRAETRDLGSGRAVAMNHGRVNGRAKSDGLC